LSLEKLRFQEELEVVYDINTEDFALPVSSVQPLVEHAVKHGVGKKIGGGTVTIHTSESESHYIIRISDDGVGFVVGGDADHNNTHVGIDNTKRRLDLMIGGDLEIESEKGKGTTASILIPKRRE
jgi:sensor histidine kinase YesM